MAEIPKEWKPAGAGEEEIEYILYDTEGGYNAANTTIQYFDQAESAVGRDETNMPLAGQLPAAQRFLIKKFVFFVNDVSAAEDEPKILDRSVMELLINSKRMFVAPLNLLVGGATMYPSGVTLDESKMAGDGYELDKYIALKGGDALRVEVETAETATATDTECTIALIGRLVRPSA